MNLINGIVDLADRVSVLAEMAQISLPGIESAIIDDEHFHMAGSYGFHFDAINGGDGSIQLIKVTYGEDPNSFEVDEIESLTFNFGAAELESKAFKNDVDRLIITAFKLIIEERLANYFRGEDLVAGADVEYHQEIQVLGKILQRAS